VNKVDEIWGTEKILVEVQKQYITVANSLNVFKTFKDNILKE
jgi:hypothetical protein